MLVPLITNGLGDLRTYEGTRGMENPADPGNSILLLGCPEVDHSLTARQPWKVPSTPANVVKDTGSTAEVRLNIAELTAP